MKHALQHGRGCQTSSQHASSWWPSKHRPGHLSKPRSIAAVVDVVATRLVVVVVDAIAARLFVMAVDAVSAGLVVVAIKAWLWPLKQALLHPLLLTSSTMAVAVSSQHQ